MTIAYLAFAAAVQGVGVSNSPAPPVVVSPSIVMPPQSVPPAAMQPPGQMIRGPQERGTSQSYFSSDDYPVAARGSGAQGKVRFTLTIDPGGRVAGCVITRSSGSAVLDAATCRIIQRRGRYTPAIDATGRPTSGTIEQEIVWKAP
jgi:protein TonB